MKRTALKQHNYSLNAYSNNQKKVPKLLKAVTGIHLRRHVVVAPRIK